MLATHDETEPDSEKLYFTIREASMRLGVPASKLRFWEKSFPELAPKKSRGGHRLYTAADLEQLRLVEYLLKVRKFTLQGAKEKLRTNPRDVAGQLQTRETLLKLRGLLVALREALPLAHASSTGVAPARASTESPDKP